ncbi:MAG: ATPase, partial [Actinomycetales bacterium]
MPSLDDIARSQTTLDEADVAWLHAVVADWQLIADLSFSDLVLWVPDAEAKGRWAAAQIRPTTGPTTLQEDVVGTFVPSEETFAFERVLKTGEPLDDVQVALDGDTAARVQLVPVRREVPVAVIERRSATFGLRASSRLETAYRQTAGELTEMIRQGEFPTPGSRSELADSLRVGDGFIRTDSRGAVLFASPNAMSAYRRLGLSGDLVGVDLADVTTALTARRPARPTDGAAVALLEG